MAAGSLFGILVQGRQGPPQCSFLARWCRGVQHQYCVWQVDSTDARNRGVGLGFKPSPWKSCMYIYTIHNMYIYIHVYMYSDIIYIYIFIYIYIHIHIIYSTWYIQLLDIHTHVWWDYRISLHTLFVWRHSSSHSLNRYPHISTSLNHIIRSQLDSSVARHRFLLPVFLGDQQHSQVSCPSNYCLGD